MLYSKQVNAWIGRVPGAKAAARVRQEEPAVDLSAHQTGFASPADHPLPQSVMSPVSFTRPLVASAQAARSVGVRPKARSFSSRDQSFRIHWSAAKRQTVRWWT
jgi:hypothetical protein